MTADLFPFLTGPVSIIISVGTLLLTGLFISFFVGDAIIMSGIKGEKKLVEKAESEIEEEAGLLKDLKAEIERDGTIFQDMEREIAALRVSVDDLRQKSDGSGGGKGDALKDWQRSDQ